MRRSYRTLLIAEAANPEWASVPLIGWSLSQALMKLTDAHIVTHIRNRDAVLRAGLVEGRDFTAIDNEKIAGRIWRLADRLGGGPGTGWTTITAFSALAYYSFEREIWRQFGSRLVAREFDLVHRITPLSPTHQSPIAKRLAAHNIPFVIGPLNGGVPWPKEFLSRQHSEREWLSHVRSLFKLMPYYRSTRRFSSAIIVGSRYTQSEMPSWAQERCVYIPENGFDVQRFTRTRQRTAAIPLEGAFVGRLVPYKGADMLLEAAADFLSNGTLELHIIGDGPQRPELERMIDQMGVRSSVRIHGWVPHAEVQNKLRACDFLALPSVREFGGGVVIEAMALGITPVVADYAGPSELVDDKTGIRIPFHDKQSLIDGLRLTLAELIRSPKTLDELGAAAHSRAHSVFTWEAKADQIAAVYDAVMAGKTNLRALDLR